MDEKLTERKEEQLPEPKKVYKAPTLTTYGKLTELTASGSVAKNENTGHPDGLP